MSPSETLEDTISRLTREAQSGDEAALSRLAAIARRTAVVEAEQPNAMTCGCGLYLHPPHRNPNAIHIADCPYGTLPDNAVAIMPRPLSCGARNVRNWFISLRVDGRASTVETGPKNREGGFEMSLLQRSDGDAVRVLAMRGYAGSDGRLHLSIDGKIVYQSER